MSTRPSSWRFQTSSSTAISAYFIGAQKSTFVLTNKDGLDVTFHYAAAGAGVSLGDFGDYGASSSTVNDWSVGEIRMADSFSGPELEVRDIEGACQIFDASAGVGTGFSGTLMAIGIPTRSIPNQLWHTSLLGMFTDHFSGNGLQSKATALLKIAGINSQGFGAGFTGSYGYVWAGEVGQKAVTLDPPVPEDRPFLTNYSTSRDLIYLPADVLFGFNQSVMKPEATGTLEAVAQKLRLLKPSRISVEGHTDAIGTDSYNYGLSYERAWTVARYLMTHNAMNPARISVIGLAHTRPVAPDTIGTSDNPKGRALNRRVEIRLYWA